MWTVRALIIFLFPFLLGCEPKVKPNKPVVVVTLPPYATFLQIIGGDLIEVRTALPEGADPHVYEPTPHQIQSLYHATLWIGVGELFEKNFVRALQQHDAHLTYLDLSQHVPLLEAPATLTLCHHHASHGNKDLHFWLSPRLMRLQVQWIAGAIKTLLPQNQQKQIDANATKLDQQLYALEKKLGDMLASVKGKAILTAHPSFGYFCQEYGLLQIPIECEGKAPKPQDLQRILTLARQHQAQCVLTEVQFDNQAAIAVAKQLNLPVFPVNALSAAYFKNLEEIANTIRLAYAQ